MRIRSEHAGTSATTPGPPGGPGRWRRLVLTAVLAILAAMVLTTSVAALAHALGVDFEVPDGGETIPLGAFATMTALFSLVGVVLAAAFLGWSARPAHRFVRTTVLLAVLSVVPALLSGAAVVTIVTLVLLHALAASVVIPALARALRTSAT